MASPRSGATTESAASACYRHPTRPPQCLIRSHPQVWEHPFILSLTRVVDPCHWHESLTWVGRAVSWHVMASHVMSCDVMSCHVMSCHVMSCHVMSCHVMSCHVMSCHVTSRHVTPCQVTSSRVTNQFLLVPRWFIFSRRVSFRVTSCHVMSCPVMSCHVMSGSFPRVVCNSR